MAHKQFEELLRRMPSIAAAVNSFHSKRLQRRAYQELIDAYRSSTAGSATDSSGTAEVNQETPDNKDQQPKGSAPSVADILAMARKGDASKADSTKGEATPKPAPAKATKKVKEAKPSPVEGIKEASQQLRGEIPEELTDGTDHFGKQSIQLLKHHGTYQQDDRENRKKVPGGKSQKSYMFMVRTKLPGGRMSSKQLLTELDLADELANDTLRITSRQGTQYHGVVKENLKEVIARINQAHMSTLGACGDVNRNVMSLPAPFKTPVYQQITELADRLADHFAPRTGAYHEVWLTDQETEEKELVAGGTNGSAKQSESNDTIEPIYGKVYLPRKFKMGICTPEDNSIDVYTHDLGLMALHADDKISGYNVIVGGGQGMTPSNKNTFPALGYKLAHVTPEQVVDVAEAIVKVQRDFGNRNDRKLARMKYLIADWGLEKFKAKVEEYYGQPLDPPTDDDVTGHNDCSGWQEQGDGRWFYGLNVENGRIKDEGEFQLKTALRKICHDLDPEIRFTAHQDIVFCDIATGDKKKLEKILTSHGVRLSAEVSNVLRWSMACVALPTCGLAITDSERALPDMIRELETEIERLDLAEEQFTLRMTGCPNGCARPYNSDIGLVGKAAGKYTLYLGGRLLGDRLSYIYQDLVPAEEVVSTLVPVLEYFKQDRLDGEGLGDFCDRKGREDLLAYAGDFTAAK
jgi:sulfite reductase (ferredoxin)